MFHVDALPGCHPAIVAFRWIGRWYLCASFIFFLNYRAYSGRGNADPWCCAAQGQFSLSPSVSFKCLVPSKTNLSRAARSQHWKSPRTPAVKLLSIPSSVEILACPGLLPGMLFVNAKRNNPNSKQIGPELQRSQQWKDPRTPAVKIFSLKPVLC